ncbi:MAG: hypothetical protein VYA99_10205 [Pseudomonadota bacterium]|nr:hypothetical protein [Pseudomonadota bacterium]
MANDVNIGRIALDANAQLKRLGYVAGHVWVGLKQGCVQIFSVGVKLAQYGRFDHVLLAKITRDLEFPRCAVLPGDKIICAYTSGGKQLRHRSDHLGRHALSLSI